jgi:hypothetical protein
MRLASTTGQRGAILYTKVSRITNQRKPPTKPSAEEQARDARRGPVETAKLPREVSQTFLGMRSSGPARETGSWDRSVLAAVFRPGLTLIGPYRNKNRTSNSRGEWQSPGGSW